MNYLLMNKDIPVAEFYREDTGIFGRYVIAAKYGTLPYGFKNIQEWLEGRREPNRRKHLLVLRRECSLVSIEDCMHVLHCTSINDTFWVKREDESISWKDVSLYDNEFDDTIMRISYDGEGVYGSTFSGITPEFAIEGSYEKCCVREDGKLYIIKRGTTGFANAGLEPYGEVFSYPIYEAITGQATKYELVNFRGKMASKCQLFTDVNIGFTSYGRIFNSSVAGEIYAYYRKLGQDELYRAMLVADAVCFNTDRHAGNHGICFRNDTLDSMGMSPIFDHNLALLPYAMKSDFDAGIDDYLSIQGPRIGENWIEVARSALTPTIRERLVNLKGYEIPFEGDENYPAWRVKEMNRLINRQIDEILK